MKNEGRASRETSEAVFITFIQMHAWIQNNDKISEIKMCPIYQTNVVTTFIICFWFSKPTWSWLDGIDG